MTLPPRRSCRHPVYGSLVQIGRSMKPVIGNTGVWVETVEGMLDAGRDVGSIAAETGVTHWAICKIDEIRRRRRTA